MCNRFSPTKTPNLETIVQYVGQNFKEFAWHLGDPKLARNILREREYHTFEIAKKGTSEKREIEAPNAQLKTLQHRALEALEMVRPAEAAHGFVKGKSNATAAAEAARKLGVAKATFIGYDMRKAFPTITRERVKAIWKKSFPELTSWQLHALSRIACRKGRLATGSPVSPHILNLCAKGIDEKMEKWCKKHGGFFLRYADDLVLVIYTHDKKRIQRARTTLARTIREEGFTPHPEKHYTCRIDRDSTHSEVVGAKVKAGEVVTRKKFRNRKRGLLRQLNRRLKTAPNTEATRKLRQRIQGMKAYEFHLAILPRPSATHRRRRRRTRAPDKGCTRLR